MEACSGNPKAGYRALYRTIAGLLAILMLAVLLLTSAIQVKISRVQQASTPSAFVTNYLAENTEYVNLPAWGRAQVVFSQIWANRRNETLNDHYKQASVAIAREDYELALDQINECLTLISPNDDAFEELKMKQGCLAALLNREDEAKQCFTEVLERNPENSEAWLLKAQMDLQSGDIGQAMEHLRQFLALQQGDGFQLSAMAQLCYASGAYEDTLTYGEQAMALLEADVDKEDLFRCMGLAGMLCGQMDKAGTYLSAALETAQDDPDLHYYRGVYRLMKEDTQGALEDFDAAIAGGMETALAYYNRGVCRLSLGDVEGLAEDMQRVVELNEDAELTAVATEILKELD